MLKLFVFTSLIYCVQTYGDLCANENKSCSTQLSTEQVPNDSCRMIYYPRTECKMKNFESHFSRTDFGNVSLKPFIDYSRTVFNVTMRNIKWKQLRMKFDLINIEICSCRDFIISQDSKVPINRVLIYDCPWSDAAFEDLEVHFQYEYGIGNDLSTKKYIFFVPKHELIDTVNSLNPYLFLYVDVSALWSFKLIIQSTAQNYVSFNISIFRMRNNITELQDIQILSGELTEEGEVSFLYQTYGEYGEYWFVVNLEGSNIKYETPKIYIPPKSYVLYIGIVGVSALIPVILLILIIWRRQYLEYEQICYKNQTLLLVASPPTDKHLDVVLALAALLRESFKIDVRVDVTDIPKYVTKNPYIWVKNAFESATHVVFLLSNNRFPTTQIIYENLDNIVISLMKIALGKKLTKQFAVVTFPYSSDVPTELPNLQRFAFMQEFSSFLDYLQRKNLCWLVRERVTLRQDRLYTDLVNAVKAAEEFANNLTEDTQVNITDVDYDVIKSNSSKFLMPERVPEISSNDNVYLYKLSEENLLGTNSEEDEECSANETSLEYQKYNVQSYNL